MRVIITENQHKEIMFKYMTLTIWVEVRNNIELFHSNNGGTGELSQKDMKSFNIRVKKLIYDFCVDRSGVSYTESLELFNLIINSIPDIIEKVDDKKQFLNEIMLGVKQGIKNWKTFSKSDKGINHLQHMLKDTLFDI
jgi:hypothetical protein